MTNNPDTRKTAAIFGAGPGLGTSLAFKLGREGYRIALVARRAEPLNDLVAALAGEGIEAVAFPADLLDIGNLPQLVRRIEDRLGGVDVAVYAPVPPGMGFVNAVDLDAATLGNFINLFTLAPVELAHTLLAGMRSRGNGALVYVGGLSGVRTAPGFSGPGQAMAAARNYVHALNAEGKGEGIHAGAVFIGGLIENSSAHRDVVASGTPIGFPVISPDTIADEIWSMVTRRDRVETVLPPGASLPVA